MLSKENSTSKSPKANFAYFAVLGVFCWGAAQQYATHTGIWLTADSFDYLAAAESLHREMILLRANGKPFVHWTPLYPILLAFIGENKSEILPFIAAQQLFFSVTLYFFLYKIIDKTLHQILAKIWTFYALLTALPIFMVSIFAWSESFFLLLLAALWYFYPDKKNTSKNFTSQSLCFALLALLLVMQRNAGIFWLLGLLLVAFSENSQDFFKSEKWRSSGFFYQKFSYFFYLLLLFLPAFIFFLWWQWRGFRLSEGKFKAQSHAYGADLMQNLNLYGSKIGNSWLPDSLFSDFLPLTLTTWVVLFVVLFIFVFLAFFAKKTTLFYFYGAALFYLMAISSLGKIQAADGERLLAPFLLVYWIGIGFFLEKTAFYFRKNNQRGYMGHLWLWGLAFFWLLYPILRLLKNAHFWHQGM
jgi:hypothetical protein